MALLGGQRHKKRDSVLISSVGPIELEGWLSKMGPGVVEGWKKRYFVLKEKRLFYFSSDKELNGNPKGLIDLLKVSAVKESGDKLNRYFTITTPERVYCLKATDERDMLRWVYGLNEVLRRIAKGESTSPRPSAELTPRSAAGNTGLLTAPQQPGPSGPAKPGGSVPPGWRYSTATAPDAAAAVHKEAKLKATEEELDQMRKTVHLQKQELENLRAKLREVDEQSVRSERANTGPASRPASASGGGCCVVM